MPSTSNGIRRAVRGGLAADSAGPAQRSAPQRSAFRCGALVFEQLCLHHDRDRLVATRLLEDSLTRGTAWFTWAPSGDYAASWSVTCAVIASTTCTIGDG